MARMVFGGWQFQGVFHELEGRGMLLGLRRSCKCLARHVLSVGNTISATCVFAAGRTGPFLSRRLCQYAGSLTHGPLTVEKMETRLLSWAIVAFECSPISSQAVCVSSPILAWQRRLLLSLCPETRIQV